MMTQGLLKYRGLVIGAIFGVTFIFGFGLTRLKVDNSPEVWLPKGTDSLKEYEDFLDRFGEDSFLLVFSSELDIEQTNAAESIADYQVELIGIEGISRVISSEDKVHPLAKNLSGTHNGVKAWAVKLDPTLAKPERFSVLDSIDTLSKKYSHSLPGLKLAGADFITRELDTGSKQSLRTLGPLVFVLLSTLLWFSTRSLKVVIAGLFAVALASISTVGLMGWLGQSMNLVLSTIPAILAVITIAQMMHLIVRFQRQHVSDDANCITQWSQTIDETWKPCALSAVTTAAGFASLGFSGLEPVRNLGLFTAFGSLVSYLLVFSLVPTLLSLLHTKPLERQNATTNIGINGMISWIRRWRVAILGTAFILTLISAWGISRLRIESNILEFFHPNHAVPKNYESAQDTLFGLTPFELVLEGNYKDVYSIESLDALIAYTYEVIESESLLTDVVTVIPPKPQAGGLHATPYINFPKLKDTPGSDAYVQRNGDIAYIRTTLLSRTSSSNTCNNLAQRLEDKLEGVFPKGVKASITGSATQLIAGQVLLLDTQIRSFSIAFLVVSIVILTVFRSFKTLAISLLPNLLPVALTLGFMGLFNIPLNTATVTVAGIALGLIVDDTLHLLYHYHQAKLASESAPIEASIRIVARPIIITSVAVAVGFAAFALSPFKPTLYFGLLIAVTSLTAMLCDLLFLPALLQGKGTLRD